jgi:hypothetical protein
VFIFRTEVVKTCVGAPPARNACASPEAAVKCLSRATFSRKMGSVKTALCVKATLCKGLCV